MYVDLVLHNKVRFGHNDVTNSGFQIHIQSTIFHNNMTTCAGHLPSMSWCREREIKSIGLFEDRGHQGTYSPYKPFNHNLYIGIVIFPHIDNPQSTGYNQPMKKTIKMINEKSEGLLQNKDFNEGSKFCRYEPFFSAHDLGVAKTLMN